MNFFSFFSAALSIAAVMGCLGFLCHKAAVLGAMINKDPVFSVDKGWAGCKSKKLWKLEVLAHTTHYTLQYINKL
jgi:hypothetical protein